MECASASQAAAAASGFCLFSVLGVHVHVNYNEHSEMSRVALALLVMMTHEGSFLALVLFTIARSGEI